MMTMTVNARGDGRAKTKKVPGVDTTTGTQQQTFLTDFLTLSWDEHSARPTKMDIGICLDGRDGIES